MVKGSVDMAKEYDLVVLGGGIGGYVAAVRASQLGMKVAIVEHDKLGGTCLHRGCIPTKALLRTAELYRQMKQAMKFGIELTDVKINFNEATKRKNTIVRKLHQGIEAILKRAKIDIFHGFGRMLGASIFSPLSGTISVEYQDEKENTMLIPKNVIIATGAKPKSLPHLKADGTYILNSDDILQMEQLPKSIIIIGGGVIGIEWASMLQDLGVQVTVVEAKDILLDQDEDIRNELKKELTRRGIKFYTNATIQSETVILDENEMSLEIVKDGELLNVSAEKVLLAVGREPNIAELGITNTTIEVENGAIVVNDMYQTKESHIYAIGDCIGGLQLAHVASKEGIIAVEHMAGLKPEPLNVHAIPSCIYSYPEVAKVGLTEREATEQGYEIKVGKFPFQANGKAHVYGETNGFVKIVADTQTEDILGVHMIGPTVTEMISEANLAKMLDASVWEVSQTIHPHPTVSESFFEAALAVDGKQIHS